MAIQKSTEFELLSQIEENESNETCLDFSKNKKDTLKIPVIKLDKLYWCQQCQKKFKSAKNLSIHISTHPSKERRFIRLKNERPYQCLLCPRAYSHFNNFKVHIRCDHSEYKPFKCETCERCFARKCDLNVHLKTNHNKNKSFICEVCSKNFRTKYQMINHNRNHHLGSKAYECDICKKLFARKYSILKHMRSHTEKKTFECNICNIKFNQHRKLKIHLLKHNNKESYPCHICGKTCLSSYNFQIHLQSHSGVKVFECNICKIQIPKYKDFILHTFIHEDEKPFICSQCSKGFLDSSGLQEHINTHLGITNKCKTCGKGFLTKFLLKVHKRSHTHPFECDICKSRFENLRSLKNHIMTHDENEDCEKNQRTTNNKSFLEQGEICGIETKVKKKRCSFCVICSKNFSSPHFLRKHQKIHLSPAPYICKICELEYKTLSRLKMHMHRHTPKDLQDIEIWKRKKLAEKQNILNNTSTIDSIKSQSNLPKEDNLKICELERKWLEETKINEEQAIKQNKQDDNLKVQEENLKLTRINYRNEKSFACDICSKNFSSINLLIEHQEEHLNSGLLLCDTCGIQFKNSISLQNHMQWHIQENQYVCDICEQIFTSSLKCYQHKKTHKKSSYSDNNETGLIKEESQSLVDLQPIVFNKDNLKTYGKRRKLEDRSKSIHKSGNHSDYSSASEKDKIIFDEIKIKTEEEDEQDEHLMVQKQFMSQDKEVLRNEVFIKSEVPEYDSYGEENSSETQIKGEYGCLDNKTGISKIAVKKLKKFHWCNTCQKEFPNAQSLKEHQTIHLTWKNQVQDERQCFPVKNVLNVHSKMYSNVFPYQCSICQRRFRDNHQFENHMLSHKRKNYFCQVCFEGFSKKLDLNTHLKEKHEEMTFDCHICKERFFSRNHFTAHNCLHPKEESYGKKPFQFQQFGNNIDDKIIDCDYYKNEYSLNLETHFNSEMRVKCPICKKIYVSKKYLNMHMKSHLTIFNCNICNEQFLKKDELEAHKLIHEINDSFVCTICSESFLNLSSLQKHGKFHSHTRPFKCEICEKRFFRRQQLREHTLIHTGQKRFECDICKQRFRTRYLVRIHIESQKCSQPCKCKFCFTIFPNKIDYKNHLQIHCKYRDFKCQICEESLTSATAFALHMFIHNEPQPPLFHNDHTYAFTFKKTVKNTRSRK